MKRIATILALALATMLVSAQTRGFRVVSSEDEAPGGFTQLTSDSDTRGDTAVGNAATVPSTRGAFLFQSPYNTQGYRLTDSTDCTGDCFMFGYALWPRVSAGESGIYYAMAPLLKANGGGGPTLFKIDQTVTPHTVTKVGAMFDSGDDRSNMLCETCFFSSSQNTKFYYQYNNDLYIYDVLTESATAVLDNANADFVALAGAGRGLIQPSASRDDDVVGSTVTSGGNYEGAIYHQISTDKWWYIAGGTGTGQDLQGSDIDASGTYAYIGDVNGGLSFNRSVQLNSNETTTVVWECDNGGPNVCDAVSHVTIGNGFAVMNSGDDGPGHSFSHNFASWSKTLIKEDNDWPWWLGIHLAVWRSASSTQADNHVLWSSFNYNVPPYGPGSDELFVTRLNTSTTKVFIAPQMLDESESYVRDSHATISGDGRLAAGQPQ